MARVINVRVSDHIMKRLENLSVKTKRPKSFYIKDMLERYLEEYEDAYLCLERQSGKNAKYYSSDEVKEILEL
jgi:RHH-type rel operon transcriptional repressor/antitoxin RelB